MSLSIPALHAVPHAGSRRIVLAPRAARALLLAMALAGAAAGFLATSGHAASLATAEAGRELTHLLRAMAALKAVFAAGALAAMYWRLGAPVAWPRFAFYAASAMAMSAGPGLIWDMAWVRFGGAAAAWGLAGRRVAAVAGSGDVGCYWGQIA